MAPSRIATMCRKLCAVTSILQAKLRRRTSRFSTSISPKHKEEDSTADDDEWGIVHAPRARPPTCRVQFVTTSHGVQVSLVLAIAPCHRTPSNLRLQRTRVVWRFSSVSSSTTCVRFVQAPMFAVKELVSSQFGAYVSDRLEFAAHRYTQWTAGSPLCWTPRPVPKTEAATSQLQLSANVEHAVALTTNEDYVADELNTSHQNANAQLKETRRRTVNTDVETSKSGLNINPRYLDYQLRAPYSSKRQTNSKRRRVFQSSSDCKKDANPASTASLAEELLDVNPRYLDYELWAPYSSKRQTNSERRRAFQSSSACKKYLNSTSTADGWKHMQSCIKHASSRLFTFEMDPAWQEKRQRSKARRAALQTAS